MADARTLTFALMDPPFESTRSTTVMRLIDIAVRRGYDVNVFAYEGAVYLPFALQTPHANPVHGHAELEEEDHPLPREWISAIMEMAAQRGRKLDWVNCGLCVDERGAVDSIDGVRRGSPGDFWSMVERSDNTLVVGTR